MATGNILNSVTERLKDGQFILSPMLTNLYEAAHGNGILLYEDAATSTGGIRTNPAALPGAITASNNVLTIKVQHIGLTRHKAQCYFYVQFCLRVRENFSGGGKRKVVNRQPKWA